MKKMLCARRGHELTVPFFEIAQISYTGNVAPEDMAQIANLARWATHDAEGQPKADAYYLCADDFFELIALMEVWRTGGLMGAQVWIEQQLRTSQPAPNNP